MGGLGRPSQPAIATTDLRTRMAQLRMLRGEVEPPTFRFSGCGTTVQDRPHMSMEPAQRSVVDGDGRRYTNMNETRNETG